MMTVMNPTYFSGGSMSRESLINSLEEVLTTLEKMGKINKDSFEC